MKLSMFEQFPLRIILRTYYGNEVFLFLFTLMIIWLHDGNTAGAKYDSQIYLAHFSRIAESHEIISKNNYEIASSPIFVHFIGFLSILAGSNLEFFIHLVYIGMGLISITVLSKLFDEVEYRKRFPLTILIITSGYFVAPIIWPTSDLPATLFILLSLYFFFSKPNSIAFSFCLFSLLSIRQNFAWLLLGFFVCELVRPINTYSKKWKWLVIRYLPSLLSLLVTFIYFDYSFTPKNYVNGQIENVFPIPNFMTSIQIGVNVLIILLPFFFYHLRNLANVKILFNSVFSILLSAFFAFGIFLSPFSFKIPNGLSWISLIFNKLGLPLFLVALATFFGILILFKVLLQVESPYNFFLTLNFTLLCFVSLLMPIPFLRYFEIPSEIIILLALAKTNNVIYEKKFFWPFLGSYFATINLLKILS